MITIKSKMLFGFYEVIICQERYPADMQEKFYG